MHPLKWRVRGFYKPICTGSEKSPHIRFNLRWPQHRIWNAPLEALVDTGSPYTAIATRDAERYQISFRSLNRDSEIIVIGFGGIEFIPRVAKNSEIVLTDEEGNRHNLKHEPLYVLEPNMPRNKWADMGVYRFPNIIGMDFLKSGRQGSIWILLLIVLRWNFKNKIVKQKYAALKPRPRIPY